MSDAAASTPAQPTYRHIPWPDDERPTERALTDRLASEGLHPYMWSNAPGDSYAAHRHDYAKVIYCVRGGITFDLLDLGASVRLAPGDRLDLAPGIAHDATVGPDGVVCLEAHRR